MDSVTAAILELWGRIGSAVMDSPSVFIDKTLYTGIMASLRFYLGSDENVWLLITIPDLLRFDKRPHKAIIKLIRGLFGILWYFSARGTKYIDYV